MPHHRDARPTGAFLAGDCLRAMVACRASQGDGRTLSSAMRVGIDVRLRKKGVAYGVYVGAARGGCNRPVWAVRIQRD